MLRKTNDRGFVVIIAIIVVIIAVALIIVITNRGDDATEPVTEPVTGQSEQPPAGPTTEPGPEQPPTPGPEQPLPPETTPTPQPGPLPANWDELSSAEKITLNPLGCDTVTQTIWASNGSCHDRPSASPVGGPFEYIGPSGGATHAANPNQLFWANSSGQPKLRCIHSRGASDQENTCQISLEFRPTTALDIETDPAPPFMSKVRNVTTYGQGNMCWAISDSFITLTTGRGDQAKVHAGSTRGRTTNAYRESIISSKDDCRTTNPDFELQGSGHWPWTWSWTFHDVLGSDLAEGATLNINGTPTVDIAADYHQFNNPLDEHVQAPLRYVDDSFEAVCDGGDGSLCHISFEVTTLTNINIKLGRYDSYTLPDFIQVDSPGDIPPLDRGDKCLRLDDDFMDTTSFVKLVRPRGSLDHLFFACYANELPDVIPAGGKYRIEVRTTGPRGAVSLIDGGLVHLKTTPGVTISDIEVDYDSDRF